MSFKAKGGAVALLLASTLVAGCMQAPQGSRSVATEKEIDRVFGGVGRWDAGRVYSAYDADGKGFFMFRGYSELPFPDRFTQRAADSYEQSLVVDFAIDFEVVSGYPLYKIGVRPRKMSLQEVRTLPGYVAINAAPREGRPSRLVAKLPASRALDENGFLWSEITYCADCFELSRVREAVARGDNTALELIDRGLEAARTGSGSNTPYAGMVRFIGYAEEGILSGQDARQMAPIASAEIAVARSSLASIQPSRQAYAAFAQSYAREITPVKAITAACGVYEPRGDLAHEQEEARVEGFVGCYQDNLVAFDRDARLKRINELAMKEDALARAGAIAEENQIEVASIKDEMSDAFEVIRAAREDFSDWKVNGAVKTMSMATATKSPAVTASAAGSPQHPERVDDNPAQVPVSVTPAPQPAASTPKVVDPTPVAPVTKPSPDSVGEPLCAIMILCPETFDGAAK